MTAKNAVSLGDYSPSRSIRSLARDIFASESPEQYVRTIPAQTIAILVQQQGLHSSTDIIEILSAEQMRCCLDIDLWRTDRFDEDRMWEWLALPDAAAATSDDPASLAVLQKLLASIDLRIIALLVHRHVEVRTFEEATDSPPGPGFFTPDRGSTWIGISVQDATKHFLLARFMALLFETNPDLFYQILAIPGISTESQLEEEAYQDRLRRLSSEGVPSDALAHELCAPLSPDRFFEVLAKRGPRPRIEDLHIIEPLVYSPAKLEPLSSMVAAILDRSREAAEQLEVELTQILNAAIVRWQIPFSEVERIELLGSQVRGAINIGIELAERREPDNLADLFLGVGLTFLFKGGLGRIESVARVIRRASLDEIRAFSEEPGLVSIVGSLREPFPSMPRFLAPGGDFIQEGGKLLAGYKAYEHVAEIEAAERALQALLQRT